MPLMMKFKWLLDGKEMELMVLRAVFIIIGATAEVFFVTCILGLFRDLRRGHRHGDLTVVRD